MEKLIWDLTLVMLQVHQYIYINLGCVQSNDRKKTFDEQKEKKTKLIYLIELQHIWTTKQQ